VAPLETETEISNILILAN